ncbi:hypothetical protein AMELA_G00296770, partial [Ameiurus melas]
GVCSAGGSPGPGLETCDSVKTRRPESLREALPFCSSCLNSDVLRLAGVGFDKAGQNQVLTSYSIKRNIWTDHPQSLWVFFFFFFKQTNTVHHFQYRACVDLDFQMKCKIYFNFSHDYGCVY